MKSIKQYDIVIVNLDPTIGHEIKKTRPCLVISPNEMNRYLRTIIVAPMTSTIREYPSRVNFQFKGQTSAIVLDQIRTIDRQRIINQSGKITKATIVKVKKILQEILVD